MAVFPLGIVNETVVDLKLPLERSYFILFHIISHSQCIESSSCFLIVLLILLLSHIIISQMVDISYKTGNTHIIHQAIKDGKSEPIKDFLAAADVANFTSNPTNLSSRKII